MNYCKLKRKNFKSEYELVINENPKITNKKKLLVEIPIDKNLFGDFIVNES